MPNADVDRAIQIIRYCGAILEKMTTCEQKPGATYIKVYAKCYGDRATQIMR